MTKVYGENIREKELRSSLNGHIIQAFILTGSCYLTNSFASAKCNEKACFNGHIVMLFFIVKETCLVNSLF
ncbi:hypothetical protein BCV72DRAFT_230790 [Rhizopus microsporus var. microsporus]|nr:hypothetical protein BCV72DRAFT_230790 [Rhizopus microsporus var. microsporus]